MSRIVYRITDEYALVARKGTANLYLEWREGGQKVARATGCSSIDDAKRRARDLILELAELQDEAAEETPIMAVLDRYWLKHGVNLPSKTTAKRAIALWREYWGETATVPELTIGRQEAFIDWLRARGYSDGYLRRVVGVGQTALNRARKRQEVASVPFVELPPGGEPFPHKASRAQLVALLNTPMPPHVWTYCLIRLNTSCRGDAALDLQPYQVDFDAKEIRLNPAGRRQTKKRRPTVPLTRTLAAHLKPLPGPYYAGWRGRRTQSIKTTWRKLRVAAKLPAWFGPKVLRHTVASELRRRGVPAWDVAGLMGHTGGGVTEGYAKFDGAKVSKALDAWMADLAKDVPALRKTSVKSVRVRRGVSGGSAGPEMKTAQPVKVAPNQPRKVVGGTGFEPVTPTMSR